MVDRTHLRWFTAASFEEMAHLCGFSVVRSFSLGTTQEALEHDDAYRSLPRDTHRADLEVRQFIFWLTPLPSSHHSPIENTGETSKEEEFLPATEIETKSKKKEIEAEEVGHEDVVHVAIAIITSSPVQNERLPQIAKAWAAWDFARIVGSQSPQISVVGISDIESVCSHGSEANNCVPTKKCPCAASKEGILCKTMCAFETLQELAPLARWYLRLMDDTLVLPTNLLIVLNTLDHTKALYIGDMVTIMPEFQLQQSAVSFALGGCGWGLTAPALELALANRATWDEVVAAVFDKEVRMAFVVSSLWLFFLF